MKKIWLIGLCIVSIVILVAGSYKTLIYRIFNDYEEVCVKYKQNATTTYGLIGNYGWELRWLNHTEYVSTGECIESVSYTHLTLPTILLV